MPARVFGGAARRLDIDGMTQPVTGRPGSCGRPLRALQNDADNVLYAVRQHVAVLWVGILTGAHS
jgi:hypothetical protein